MWANGENCRPKAAQKGDNEDLNIITKYLFHGIQVRHYDLTNGDHLYLYRSEKRTR